MKSRKEIVLFTTGQGAASKRCYETRPTRRAMVDVLVSRLTFDMSVVSTGAKRRLACLLEEGLSGSTSGMRKRGVVKGKDSSALRCEPMEVKVGIQ
jgi:hypothetical protein